VTDLPCPRIEFPLARVLPGKLKDGPGACLFSVRRWRQKGYLSTVSPLWDRVLDLIGGHAPRSRIRSEVAKGLCVYNATFRQLVLLYS